MTASIETRPTILIMADTSGYQSSEPCIFSALNRLVAGIHPDLLQIIGGIDANNLEDAHIIPFTIRGVDYYPFGMSAPQTSINEDFVDGEMDDTDFDNDMSMNPHQIAFPELFGNMLKNVMSNEPIHNIKGISLPHYHFGQTLPQVFIIGKQSSDIHTIAMQVRQVINKLGYYTLQTIFVAYVLIDSHVLTAQELGFQTDNPVNPYQHRTNAWIPDLINFFGDPSVNYCFYFEDLYREQPRFISLQGLHYAIAEFLFLCLAPPMIHNSISQAFLKGNNLQRDAYGRIGPIATSIIRFPRGESEAYSALLLSATMVKYMLNGLNKNVSKEDQNRQRREAEKREELISETIFDNEPRPEASEYLWSSLQILEDSLKSVPRDCRVRNELIRRNEHLFKRLQCDNQFDETFTQMELIEIENSSWQNLMNYFSVAEIAWLRARVLLSDGIEQDIDSLWLKGNIVEAQAYVNRLREALEYLMTKKIIEERKNHEARFTALRDRMKSKINGPWKISTENQPHSANGSAIAMGNDVEKMNHDDVNTPFSDIDQDNNQQAEHNEQQTQDRDNANNRLTDDDQMIFDNLIRRMEWRRANRPKTIQFVGVGLASIPTFILLFLSLTPAAFTSILMMLIDTMMSIGIFTAAVVLTYLLSRRLIQESEEDIFTFLRATFVYQCEDFEDKLRIAIVQPLYDDMRILSDRLDNIEPYLMKLEKTFTNEANEVDRVLFSDPIAYRDIFIANGQLLARSGLRLNFVNECVVAMRKQTPIEDWHRSEWEISEHLRNELLSNIEQSRDHTSPGTKQSFLLLDIDELKRRFEQFSYSVNAHYFDGNLANITSTIQLDKQGDLIKQALQRADPLYNSFALPQEFVLGATDPQISNIISPNVRERFADILPAESEEWLAVMRIWPGGGHNPNIDISNIDEDSPHPQNDADAGPSWT